MKPRTVRMIAALSIVSLLAACESTSAASTTATETATTTTTTAASTTTTTTPPTSDATPVALHPIPPDFLLVSGTATCRFSETGVDPEGGAGFLVTCRLEMSDPRVSGTETHDRIRFHTGGEVGDVWVAEEAIITNAEGTWRGIAQAADDGLPCGEAHYVGEGAYAGLEFHYYFGHFEDSIVVRGWVAGGD